MHEAIGAVATAPICEAVVGAALRAARRTSIPECGLDVVHFADGPLRRALAMRIGEDIAEEVLEQIGPLLRHASSRTVPANHRPSAPPESGAVPAGSRASVRPTMPIDSVLSPEAVTELQLSAFHATGGRNPSPDDIAASYVRECERVDTSPAPAHAIVMVFLASNDPDLASALAGALGGRAVVRAVNGLLDLLDLIDEESGVACTVVLDGGLPSVQLASLIAVGPDLRGRAGVVVWRPSEDDRIALSTSREITAGWTTLHEDSFAAVTKVVVDSLA